MPQQDPQNPYAKQPPEACMWLELNDATLIYV